MGGEEPCGAGEEAEPPRVPNQSVPSVVSIALGKESYMGKKIAGDVILRAETGGLYR